jgi:cephalosporin-C deacetylase-like acetyl esterase
MTARTVERRDVWFRSGGGRCAAWLYTPAAAGPRPAVVMAHGLGGQRRHRLDAYAERFAGAGFACLVFDYRHFAESDGVPRQLVSIGRQLTDWSAALTFARAHPQVDATRIAVWGTSLSGGHVQVLAAKDHRIAAAVSQVPFADGLAASRAVPLRHAVRLVVAGNRDLLRMALRRKPYRIRIFGAPGTLAAMTAAGAQETIRAKLLPPGQWDETMPARVVSLLPYYRPARHARRIACPILFQVADYDNVTPPKSAVKAAARAPRSELKRYAIDHFDIYADEPFEQAVTDQLEFLTRHLQLPGNHALTQADPAGSKGPSAMPGQARW